MKRVMWMGVLALTMAGLAGAKAATETAPEISHGEHIAEAAEVQSGPMISADGAWAGMLGGIIVLGFFAPAALVGPIVWARKPRISVTSSHVAEHKGHDDGHASHGH